MSIDKYLKITIVALVVLEVLSFLAFQNQHLNTVIFLSILLITLGLSLKRLEYGLFILLAELFVGGKGYLFALDFGQVELSIRIGLFLVILSIWLFKKIQNPKLKIQNLKIKIKNNKLLVISYSLLVLMIGWGLANGLIKNSFNHVFFDFNAWLFFALFLIFLDQIKSIDQVKKILSIFLAAIFWVSLKTIIVLYLFSHRFVIIGDNFYKWIRDTGVGEITYISGDIFRVFFQSQIYVLIAFFILLIIFIFSIKDKNLLKEEKWSKSLFLVTLLTILVSTTILISQSRSFWLAGLITFITFAFLVLPVLKIKKNVIIGILIFALILGVFDSMIIYIITQSSSIKLVTARTASPTTEAAGNTRINQLKPLFTEIKKDPIFGSGYGSTVTYKSSDPRILATHPDGMYTTYAFEWGYLDIWLKIGLAGLLAYLAFLAAVFKLGIQFYKKNQSLETKSLALGLILGLIALMVTNIFTPYLNHPLGIGYLLLLVATFSIKD